MPTRAEVAVASARVLIAHERDQPPCAAFSVAARSPRWVAGTPQRSPHRSSHSSRAALHYHCDPLAAEHRRFLRVPLRWPRRRRGNRLRRSPRIVGGRRESGAFVSTLIDSCGSPIERQIHINRSAAPLERFISRVPRLLAVGAAAVWPQAPCSSETSVAQLVSVGGYHVDLRVELCVK